MAATNDLEAYNSYIEQMREKEYPMLKNSLYLDHAGTTLYSKSLIDSFHADMLANIYGNPHSAAPSSQKSTHDIEGIRLQALHYFGASPDQFDLVFTSNTTAAIKLVMEAFREQDDGFWYGYHVDSHTSLVGVREAAKQHRCFESDDAVEQWLDEPEMQDGPIQLFAYPAQSNMNGRRLPLGWTPRLHDRRSGSRVYSLLDAAAYAATHPLSLEDVNAAPDFIVLSFTKIFGFPDLGALIVKKDCAHLFDCRHYFGGGTVDMVVCLQEQWHAKKSGTIHEALEDGTLPVHNILALKSAIRTHTRLFGALDEVAKHTSALATRLRGGLATLKHENGRAVCKIYSHPESRYGHLASQGPTVAFNMQDSNGCWVSNAEVEKLAAIKDIHVRAGGLCNPGGVASALSLAPWEMRENFSSGFRCGSENDILNGKPTGVIRVSLGAISTCADVERFLAFIDEFFVNHAPATEVLPPTNPLIADGSRLHVESLTVYPIKSCAGYQIPYGISWDIHSEGLAWDREWCIVKEGSGAALSQKAHPRMALIRPTLDFKAGLLRVKAPGSDDELKIPLSKDPSLFYGTQGTSTLCNASVCGDKISAKLYSAPAVSNFFTNAIGVPCTLARFPASSQTSPSARLSKPHMGDGISARRPLLLSNESPILTISRSSLNRLNETIKAKGGKAAHPAVFRANIVLAESPLLPPGQEKPWAEDHWAGMTIGDSAVSSGVSIEFLGGCRRCQMVCIDQENAEKNHEPFVTLAKTRRFAGRVLFGLHSALTAQQVNTTCTIKVGDSAVPRAKT